MTEHLPRRGFLRMLALGPIAAPAAVAAAMQVRSPATVAELKVAVDVSAIEAAIGKITASLPSLILKTVERDMKRRALT